MLTFTITSFRDDIDKGKTFIGNTGFFLSKDVDLEFWFFQFAFACAVSSIVAGTIAERCKMTAYLFYSLVSNSSQACILLSHLLLYLIYNISTHIHTTVLIRLCLPCSSPLILECQWIPLCFCCRATLGCRSNRLSWLWRSAHDWWRCSSRYGDHFRTS